MLLSSFRTKKIKKKTVLRFQNFYNQYFYYSVEFIA